MQMRFATGRQASVSRGRPGWHGMLEDGSTETAGVRRISRLLFVVGPPVFRQRPPPSARGS
jgi:hypothetical protein